MKARSLALLLAASFLLTAPAFGNTGTSNHVQSGVYLSYGGLLVSWPAGLYGDCTVTTTATDCLITNAVIPVSSGSSGLLYAAILGVVLLVGLAFIVARRRR